MSNSTFTKLKKKRLTQQNFTLVLLKVRIISCDKSQGEIRETCSSNVTLPDHVLLLHSKTEKRKREKGHDRVRQGLRLPLLETPRVI